MTQMWRQQQASKNRETEQQTEVSLAAMDGKASGKTCWHCGEKGHIARDCPKKRKNQGRSKNNNSGGGGGNNGGNKKCDICGKTGHTEANCWHKAENASKRPAWFVPRNSEVGAAGTDNNNGGTDVAEMLFMAIDSNEDNENNVKKMGFPEQLALLKDPNVWIADTAATVHSTPCTIGLKNVREATQCEAITMGNGAKEQASMVGDLPGMLCDKHGNQIGRGVLQQVKIIQNGQFNLFSISKMMKQGWELSGSQKEMVISKGKNRIVFDIVIPTTEGVLYAIYHRRDANNELAAANNDGTEATEDECEEGTQITWTSE